MSGDLRFMRLVAARLLVHARRQPALAFAVPTVLPLGLVVFISQLYQRMAEQPGYPVDDLLAWMGPGMVFLAATMGGGFSATTLVIDAESGFLDRLRLLAVPTRAVIGGCLAFEALRILPAGVALLAAARGLGMGLPSPPALLLVLGLSGLWAATWNAMFVVAALRTRNPHLPQALLPLFLPFFLSSTIMVPAALLPGYVQALVAWNPLDRFVVAVRPLFLGSGVHLTDVALAVAFALALVIPLGAVAQHQHRRL